jgi:hypothetical protein
MTFMAVGAMRRLSKEHPKAAVFVMIGLNAGYACVVGSNFRYAAGR